MFVIDVSVLMADARPTEPGHPASQALLTLLAQRRLTVSLPTIALAEVAAAITRGTGRSSLATQLINVLRQMPHYTLCSVDEALGERAASIAARQGLRGCDAVYVALAEQLDNVLVTLDQEQRSRAPETITVLSPTEALLRVS